VFSSDHPPRFSLRYTKPNAGRGELGEGPVSALVPSDHPGAAARAFYARTWLEAALAARGTADEERTVALYRAEFRRQLEAWGVEALAPGRLYANARPHAWVAHVADGDTLCCACSAANAARGLCHRAWAAPYLVRAGWRVLLDGVEVTDAGA
jgi:hypothetical protein